LHGLKDCLVTVKKSLHTLCTASIFLAIIEITLLEVGNHENKEIITFISWPCFNSCIR